jgi:hypothetical protein
MFRKYIITFSGAAQAIFCFGRGFWPWAASPAEPGARDGDIEIAREDLDIGGGLC